MSSPFESGQSVGRYRILRTLGSGAMGVVYLAQDPQIERFLAIKTVRLVPEGTLELGEMAERRERLLREARTAGRLIHPHIVTLFDAGEHEGTLYLALEYVEGVNLSERLRQESPLTLAEALRITREAASGLAFAHRRGIVHRDVKPANLLLAEDGRVKISDFGIAKVLGQATELTVTGSVVGSPHYLSPEQVRGEPLDGRSDLFSLGVVFYELLGGRRPFDGETLTTLLYQILHQEPPPMALRPGVPAGLVEVLSRLLAKDRDERYADGDEVAAALAALASELPAEVLATPAVVMGSAGQVEATRLLPMTGLQPIAAATRPAEAPGEPAATRAPGAPPPSGAPGAAPPPGSLAAPGVAPAPAAAPEAAPASRRKLWIAAALALVILIAAAGAVAVAGLRWWQGAGSARLAALLAREPVAGESAALDGAGAPPEATATESAAEPAAEVGAAAGEGPPPPAVPAARPPATTGAALDEPPAPAGPEAGRRPAPATAAPAGEPGGGAAAQVEARPEPAAAAPPAAPGPASADPAADPAAAEPEGEVPALRPGAARRLEQALERRPELRRAVEDAVERSAPDQEIATGLALVFDVQPAQSFALLDGTVIGRVSEHDARSGSPFVLPGAGEYLLKLRSPGMEDHRILLRASASGPARTTVTVRLRAAAAAELALGDLPLVRVREAVGFAVSPAHAEVEVDGRSVGRANRYPGRFARPASWLRLPPGRHRVSLSAPGFERRDYAVDVSGGAEEERQRIEVRLEPAAGPAGGGR